MAKIGILALQGAYQKHGEVMRSLGQEVIYVRTAEELMQVNALILPGGESTTMGKLMNWYGLFEPMRKRINEGMPVFGTCAGMILLSKSTDKQKDNLIALMDIEVERNAYGAQIESFEAKIENTVYNTPISALFIRAPRISKIGNDVEVLAKWEGVPVWVRQKNMLAASFHSELTNDTRVHEYFLKMIKS